MKQYSYVRINGNEFGGATFDKHRTIMDEYALKWFSYVGFIPVSITENGIFKELDFTSVFCYFDWLTHLIRTDWRLSYALRAS